MIQAFFARSYNPRAHKILNKGKTMICGWKSKEKNYILQYDYTVQTTLRRKTTF